MTRIFLCHANEDKPQVREVYLRLKEEGFEPWLDEEDLLPGQLWDQEIRRALRNSDFILIFFSQNSVAKRGYVQREMKLALAAWEEIPEGQIYTIPVRLDECQIPEQFKPFQWVDLFTERGFERIVRAIRVGVGQHSNAKPVLNDLPTQQQTLGRNPTSFQAGGTVTNSSVSFSSAPPKQEDPRIRLASDQEIRQYDHKLKSLQYKLGRVGPSRVHITYDVHGLPIIQHATNELDYIRYQLLWVLTQIVTIKAKSESRA